MVGEQDYNAKKPPQKNLFLNLKNFIVRAPKEDPLMFEVRPNKAKRTEAAVSGKTGDTMKIYEFRCSTDLEKKLWVNTLGDAKVFEDLGY